MNIKKKKFRYPMKFRYADIAKLTGLTEGTVAAMSHRGKFDRRSLESILKFVMSHYIMRVVIKQEKDG